MPLFDGILNGLLANRRTLENQGLSFDNRQKEIGLFESGLKSFRNNQFNESFENLSESGLDPLRNSLSLFKNASTPEEAQRALGLFTSLRQPAASASLFDREAVGIPGLPTTATGLTRQGFGGLNAALGLEQQDRALALSQVNNPALAMSQLTGTPELGNDNQALMNSLGAMQDALATVVGTQQAAQIARNAGVPSSVTPVSGTDSAGQPFTDPGISTAPARDASGNAPVNTGAFRTPVEQSATAVRDATVALTAAQTRLDAVKNLGNTEPMFLKSYENAVLKAEKMLERAKLDRDMALIE